MWEMTPGLEPEERVEDLVRRVTGQEDIGTVTTLALTVDTHATQVDHLGVLMPLLAELRLEHGSTLASFRDLGSSLVQLRVLWLSRCGVRHLDGVGALVRLEELYLAFNDVDDLTSIALHDRLEVLDLESNDVQDHEQAMHLGTCPRLWSLTLAANPVSRHPAYRHVVVEIVPQLVSLDERDVTDADRRGMAEANSELANAMSSSTEEASSPHEEPRSGESSQSSFTKSVPAGADTGHQPGDSRYGLSTPKHSESFEDCTASDGGRSFDLRARAGQASTSVEVTFSQSVKGPVKDSVRIGAPDGPSIPQQLLRPCSSGVNESRVLDDTDNVLGRMNRTSVLGREVRAVASAAMVRSGSGASYARKIRKSLTREGGAGGHAKDEAKTEPPEAGHSAVNSIRVGAIAVDAPVLVDEEQIVADAIKMFRLSSSSRDTGVEAETEADDGFECGEEADKSSSLQASAGRDAIWTEDGEDIQSLSRGSKALGFDSPRQGWKREGISGRGEGTGARERGENEWLLKVLRLNGFNLAGDNDRQSQGARGSSSTLTHGSQVSIAGNPALGLRRRATEKRVDETGIASDLNTSGAEDPIAQTESSYDCVLNAWGAEHDSSATRAGRITNGTRTCLTAATSPGNRSIGALARTQPVLSSWEQGARIFHTLDETVQGPKGEVSREPVACPDEPEALQTCLRALWDQNGSSMDDVAHRKASHEEDKRLQDGAPFDPSRFHPGASPIRGSSPASDCTDASERSGHRDDMAAGNGHPGTATGRALAESISSAPLSTIEEPGATASKEVNCAPVDLSKTGTVLKWSRLKQHRLRRRGAWPCGVFSADACRDRAASFGPASGTFNVSIETTPEGETVLGERRSRLRNLLHSKSGESLRPLAHKSGEPVVSEGRSSTKSTEGAHEASPTMMRTWSRGGGGGGDDGSGAFVTGVEALTAGQQRQPDAWLASSLHNGWEGSRVAPLASSSQSSLSQGKVMTAPEMPETPGGNRRSSTAREASAGSGGHACKRSGTPSSPDADEQGPAPCSPSEVSVEESGADTLKDDEYVMALLRRGPKDFPQMRSRDSFLAFFKGMDRERLARLVRAAHSECRPHEIDGKAKKRLALIERSWARLPPELS